MEKLKPSQYITSLAQFIEIAERMRGYGSAKQWIFRGQTRLRADWPLRPKIGRAEFWESKLAKRYGWRDAEELKTDAPGTREKTVIRDFYPPPDIGMLEHWCDRAVAVQTLPENHWEQLALAQHYGLATRLLDWTENPLVGLFFAAISGEEAGYYGGAYAFLRPNNVTRDTSFADCGRSLYSNKGLSEVLFAQASRFSFDDVLTYVPRPFDRRMLQQSAVFTYHVKPALPIEPTPIREDAPQDVKRWRWVADATALEVGFDLIEFIVAPEYKDPIVRGLAALGIRYDTLFPDLEGLSRQFNRETRSTITIRTKGIALNEGGSKPSKPE